MLVREELEDADDFAFVQSMYEFIEREESLETTSLSINISEVEMTTQKLRPTQMDIKPELVAARSCVGFWGQFFSRKENEKPASQQKPAPFLSCLSRGKSEK